MQSRTLSSARNTQLFLEILQVMFSRLKTIRPIQIVTRERLKDQHLWWYWVVIVAMALVTCTSVKAPQILKGTQRFWSNMCCHQVDVQGRPCSMQQDNAKPHTTRSYRDVGARLASLGNNMTPNCWETEMIYYRKNEQLIVFKELTISSSALRYWLLIKKNRWCNTMVIMPVLQFFLK